MLLLFLLFQQYRTLKSTGKRTEPWGSSFLRYLYLLALPFHNTLNFLSESIFSNCRSVFLRFTNWTVLQSSPLFHTADDKSRKTAPDFFLYWKPVVNFRIEWTIFHLINFHLCINSNLFSILWLTQAKYTFFDFENVCVFELISAYMTNR